MATKVITVEDFANGTFHYLVGDEIVCSEAVDLDESVLEEVQAELESVSWVSQGARKGIAA